MIMIALTDPTFRHRIPRFLRLSFLSSCILCLPLLTTLSWSPLQTVFTSLWHQTRRRYKANATALQGLKLRNEPIYSEEAWSDKDETNRPGMLNVEDLRIGQELIGIVTGVAEFGCFVDVGANKEGLVHISRISRSYIADVTSVVKPGQRVQVWVSELVKGRLLLTMIAPGSTADGEGQDFSAFLGATTDQWFDGEVKGLSSFGATVSVTPPNGGEPVLGVIHVSQFKDGFVEHPADCVREGQNVKVRVLDIDRSRTMLKLSMRKISVAGKIIAEKQDVSALVEISPTQWFDGRVDHAAPFGIFVEVDPTNSGKPVQGLVHVSEIKDGFVIDPVAEVQEGQKIKVRILSADAKSGRVALSLKKLPEPY